MNSIQKKIIKIASNILADYKYIYDPDHRKNPGAGFERTEDGWSSGKQKKEKQSERRKRLREKKIKSKKTLKGLFDGIKMSGKKYNDDCTSETTFFQKAEEAQNIMEKTLNNGSEKDWLGKSAVCCKMNMEEISSPGKKLIIGPLKSSKRARQKVTHDYGGDWRKLRDGVRCSVVVDKVDDIPSVLKGLEKVGCKISNTKNRLSKPLASGYGDCLLNVEYSNGFVGEIQIHLKQMLLAKQFRKGHKLYEQEREIVAKYDAHTSSENFSGADKKSLRKLRATQQKLYGTAMKKAILSSVQKETKYLLSDEEFSFYLYGDDDAIAYCYKDNFPKFWNGKKWVEERSFLRFLDESTKISKEEFTSIYEKIFKN